MPGNTLINWGTELYSKDEFKRNNVDILFLQSRNINIINDSTFIHGLSIDVMMFNSRTGLGDVAGVRPNMKPIGGFFELELPQRGKVYHKNAIPLSTDVPVEFDHSETRPKKIYPLLYL
jgi:hypothetical protein